MHYVKDNLRTLLFTESVSKAAAVFILSGIFFPPGTPSKYTPKYKCDRPHNSRTALGQFGVTGVWLVYCN